MLHGNPVWSARSCLSPTRLLTSVSAYQLERKFRLASAFRENVVSSRSVLGVGASTQSTQTAARGGTGGKTAMGGKTATGGLGGRAATGGGRTLGGAGRREEVCSTMTMLGSMKRILPVIRKPLVRSTGLAFVVPLDPLSEPGEELERWSPAPSVFVGGDHSTNWCRSGALGDHTRGSCMRVSVSPSPSTEKLDVTGESPSCSEALEVGSSVT